MMGLGIDVLVAGRTIHVPTTMTLNVFETHFEFETSLTFTTSEADGGLGGVSGVSSIVFGAMGLETGVTEKVPSTSMAMLRGFETPWVGVEVIGALFLETGMATKFDFAAMTSFLVVGFKAVGTHVIGAEKSGETGDDIIVTFFVE